MADDKVVADCSGLQVSNNVFSASPPGAMSQAVNVVIPQKGIAEPRRGQDAFAVPEAAGQVPLAVTETISAANPPGVIFNAGTSKTDTSMALSVAGVGDFSNGPFNPVDDDGSSTSYGRMKFCNTGQATHFCTTTGPKVADDVFQFEPRSSGLLQPPVILAYLTSPSGMSSGNLFLPYGAAVAYRSVCRRATPSGVSLLSPPSGRTVIANRLVSLVGDMTRSGGTTVTVTIAGIQHGLNVGDSFTLDPGEANFPAGSYTVASTPSLYSLTYASAGANVSNAVAQDFDAGQRAVVLSGYLASDEIDGDFFRFYRSLYTSSASVEPGDEMFLISEKSISIGDVGNGYVSFTDTTPQSVINDPLYTNPQTGEGALQANYRPPIYRDLANFQGSTWYANTTGPQRLRMQMLGVGSPGGIQAGDTVDITLPDSTVLSIEFVASSPGSGQVLIVSDGLPSSNIQATTFGLVVEINNQAISGSYQISAYVTSSQDSAPGLFVIESTALGDDPFQVQVSRPASWTPAFNANQDVDSTAERMPNGLWYSKAGQPEAVPPVNFTLIGSPNYPIERIAALQQSLVVFKGGDGVYTVSGSAPYQVVQISVANIIAVDAVAVLADNVWAYTDQGVMRISQSGGVSVISRPVETILDDLRDALPDETFDYSFMVPYETERRLYLYVPVGISTVAPELPILEAYCYNNATQAWSGPLTPNAFCGVVQPSTDKLLLGQYDYAAETGRLTQERKGSGLLDYADLALSLSIIGTVISPPDLTVIQLSDASDVEAGDGITQGSFRSKVKELRPDLGAGWVELYDAIPWNIDTCAVFKAYEVLAQWQPTGNPTSRKTLTRLSFIFLPAAYEALGGKALLLTDQCQAELEIDAPARGFGLATTASGGGFGATPFGDPSPLVLDINPIAPQWTNAAQYFPGFRIKEAWCKMRLQGWGAMIEGASAPAGRGR